MTFEPGPTPAQSALMLSITLGVCIGAMLLAGRLRRRDSRFAWAAAGLLFFLAAAILLLTGLSLVYPHHHHDTAWTGDWDLNYWIDAAIGVAFWAAYGVAYFRVWKARGSTEVR